MRVLLLSKYGRLGASSRLRSHQYLPVLSSHGIDVTVAPLFNDQYVEALYGGRRSALTLLRSYSTRLRALGLAGRYDLLWVEKECLPWFPPSLEMLSYPRRVPYLADYDDAQFHRYDLHHSSLVRRLLGKKIDAVMRRAALVTVGNSYLANRARRAGAERVELIPTVVDIDRYKPRVAEPGRPLTIGWIGTPVTSHFMEDIAIALGEVVRQRDARVVVIGAPNLRLGNLTLEHRPWSEATEASDIASLDVGLMPLRDDPWERGKCGYKLIQYMACGLPVIASPVGVNNEIVEHNRNGFLARTPEDWTTYLLSLADNRSLARAMGERGRKKVELTYNLSVTAPRLAGLLQDAATSPRH